MIYYQTKDFPGISQLQLSVHGRFIQWFMLISTPAKTPSGCLLSNSLLGDFLGSTGLLRTVMNVWNWKLSNHFKANHLLGRHSKISPPFKIYHRAVTTELNYARIVQPKVANACHGWGDLKWKQSCFSFSHQNVTVICWPEVITTKERWNFQCKLEKRQTKDEFIEWLNK